MIHPLALVHPQAKIASDVEVGAWTQIEAGVEIGAGCKISSHVVIRSGTKIGEQCDISPFATVGAAPQHRKYQNQGTILEIGAHNVIREGVTLSLGTPEGEGTKIGDRNLFMAYVHIGHDCSIGNDNIFANVATLAGHVVIEDFTYLSGHSGLHQFCKMGSYSLLGMRCAASKDVLPFTMVAGADPTCRGINVVGLRRRGFSEQSIQELRQAYKIIFRDGLTLNNAVEELKKRFSGSEVDLMLNFLNKSTRGIVR